jgi:hypothetical protein
LRVLGKPVSSATGAEMGTREIICGRA